MIAYIQDIGVAAGQEKIDNQAQGKAFEVEEGFVKEKLGVLSMPQLGDDETPLELAQRAVKDLSDSHGDIDALIYVTQNPVFGGLPHNSAILAGMLDLPQHTACFDLGLGCSGFVYSASLAASMIESGRHDTVLIVTCDPYRKNLKYNDKNTRLLFGDWACATLVGKTGTWKIGASQLETIGKGYKNLIRQDDGIFMNGRGVFNFARNVVSKSLSEFCVKYVDGVENVDLFLAHQGSKIVVEELAKKIGIDFDKMPSDMMETGNAVSSSIPLLVKKHILTGSNPHTTVAASGFGVGLSIGHILLHKE